VQIVSGMYYSCGVTLEQSVMCWGRLPDVPISGLYSQITGGKHYACGVMTDGRLNCWGLINAGVKREIPTEAYMEAHNIERFVQVSCEDNHCCALDDKGKPYFAFLRKVSKHCAHYIVVVFTLQVTRIAGARSKCGGLW
jgi:hypothetical protein